MSSSLSASPYLRGCLRWCKKLNAFLAVAPGAVAVRRCSGAMRLHMRAKLCYLSLSSSLYPLSPMQGSKPDVRLG